MGLWTWRRLRSKPRARPKRHGAQVAQAQVAVIEAAVEAATVAEEVAATRAEEAAAVATIEVATRGVVDHTDPIAERRGQEVEV